jgi:hypothetical protein
VLKKTEPDTCIMESIQNINMTAVNFSELKKNPKGGKFINITINGKPIIMQLPALRAPFGMSQPNDQVKDYYLSLSLVPEVEEKFKELDELIIKYVSENSVQLLGKQLTPDVIRDLLLNPLVKVAKDQKYSNTIKMKCSSNAGKNVVDFYVSKNEKMNVDDIRGGTSIETIVEVSQIWFINGKFGASIKLLQGKVAPSTKLVGYAFGEDEEDEEIEI